MSPFARRALPRALAAAATLFALSACKDEIPPPAALAAIGESQFTGTVGEKLTTPISVKVTDAKGGAVGGVAVTFAVTEGGGSVSRAIDTTTSAGLATTTWQLGERAGSQRVTATVAGVSGAITFNATARPGAAATIASNGGNQQTVVVGTAVLTAPSVIVKDRFANPVPGVSVIFTVASGGGSITGGGATTNAAGIAAVTEWKVGPSVGANSLTALALASGVTGNPVTFTATGTAGTPATVAAQGSTTLSGVVFTTVSPVPSVKVTDASGNAVAGASVTFTGSAGSTVAGGTKSTDANGLASPDAWALGTQARAYTLSATVGSIPAVVFTANARAGAATTMTAVAGNSQSVLAGRPVPVEPSVRVTDIHGNPVAGLDVLFEVASGGGSAVGRRVATDANGTATVGGWTLGDAVGTNTLVASVATSGVSVPAVTFTATATAGAAATMAASAGQNQTAQAGAAVAVAPAVVVRDARGNPVSGVAVTFTIGTGNGTLTGGSAITNASGVATVGSWTLGGAVGTQTLIARSGSLTEVTFTATATAGVVARITSWSVQDLTGITAGATLTVSQRPAVRVTDAEGNPVPGVAVVFRVAQDGSMGRLGTTTADTVATATSNVNGIATVPAWVMPTTVGRVSLVASTSGLAETVTFRVTTTAGAPASMSTRVNTSIGPVTVGGTVAGASLPSVQLTDVNGNPVVGVTVVFTAGATAGTITGGSATTDLNGVATLASWTVSSTTLGAATVTASYGSLPAVAFTASVVASAAQSTVSTGSGTVNQGLTTTITVTLKDPSGVTIATATGAGAASSFSAVVAATTGAIGSIGAFSCTNGSCTATYTAPSATGTSTVSVTIGGVAVSLSPVTIITP